MTIQSTLIPHAAEGWLIQWLLADEDDRQPQRLLFLNPVLEEWLNETLSPIRKIRGLRRPPYEQVEDFFDRFVGDPSFNPTGYFQNIIPQSDGVYEMKPEAVLLFGGFAAARCFVVACGELKAKLKGGGYGACRKQTIAFRRSLSLPQPDFIRGHGNVSSLL